jgi:hypothetical protein
MHVYVFLFTSVLDTLGYPSTACCIGGHIACVYDCVLLVQH